MTILSKGRRLLLSALLLAPLAAQADSIDPVSYSDTLEVGESVTIRKTVTISAGGPTDALLDVMFVFDVTGSMGDEIDSAKAAANAILAGLAGFGNLQSGTGWYADPLAEGVHVDLNSGNTGNSSGINDMWDSGSCTVAGMAAGCGGDFPEVGWAGISEAASDASWRPGSNRFIVAFGDASFKGPPDSAATIAALTANNVTALGVSYSSSFEADMQPLAAATGGAISDNPADVTAAILALVGDALATYTEVTVDDLGGGMPGVDVSVSCVSADIGSCAGAVATGDYDRDSERSFEFDVTFTGMAEGTYNFETYGVVDGGIVATEADRFVIGDGDTPPGEVPVPGTLLLLGLGLSLLGFRKRGLPA